MNKANLKSYAPKARLDFIKAVTERANVLGISASGVVPAEVRGDVALIDGREWPAKVAGQREELIARIKRHGFEQTMDEVAYTWFNRFAALRYMEIHDYLGHGWRVLSSRDGGLPEILRHASEVTLPGLNTDRARELQLAGNQDNELYKLLLVAQCNDLSRVMPFLFERIDDETELLLPENLLRTDSIVAKLVESVPEEDWQEIEIIGWLYQFYISEKKDQVIGKVVKSEDIPAATQLFTPNWIVQYLVQNSVGRLWLMANPTSTLASQWPYYIPPAEQTPEVHAQLDVLIQARIREDGETLNPETITVLDPACGSGHILVVAYDVLKAIYLERGYQLRSIPRLILEKNLYGLDIDDRAGQFAAFALLMKARADDRRLFYDSPRLNVLSLQGSGGLALGEMVTHLAPFGVPCVLLKGLLDTFASANAFGSLIQIPAALTEQLAGLGNAWQETLRDGDLYAQRAAKDILPLVRQSLILSMQFDVVVANPPYMGSKFYNESLKTYTKASYTSAKADLYSCFMVRGMRFTRPGGRMAMISIPNWMFLSSFEGVRNYLLSEATIETLTHNGRGVFGSDFGSCAFTCLNVSSPLFLGAYRKLFERQGSVASNEELANRFQHAKTYLVPSSRFDGIPGRPLTFWLSERVVELFKKYRTIGQDFSARQGLATSDNGRFVRLWHEVPIQNIGFGLRGQEATVNASTRWYPYNKGGEFKKWWGNQTFVVDWKDDGEAIKRAIVEKYTYLNGNPNFVAKNQAFYFRTSVSFSKVGSGFPAFRFFPNGFIFDVAGSSIFTGAESEQLQILSFANTNIARLILSALAPTLNIEIEQIHNLPVGVKTTWPDLEDVVRSLVEVAKADWDSVETSWDFSEFALLRRGTWALPGAVPTGNWGGALSPMLGTTGRDTVPRQSPSRGNLRFSITIHGSTRMVFRMRSSRTSLKKRLLCIAQSEQQIFRA